MKNYVLYSNNAIVILIIHYLLIYSLLYVHKTPKECWCKKHVIGELRYFIRN